MFSDRSTVTPVRKYKGYNYSKKSNSQKYTVTCLTVIGLCLVGTGIALIIVGDVYDVEDLLILGPIFLIAGVGFTIMMVAIITKPLCEKIARKNKIRCEKQEKHKGNKSKIKIVVEDNYTLPKTESKPYFQDYQEKLKEAEEVNQRQSPSKEELYEKSAVSGEHLMSKFLPPGAIEFDNERHFSGNGSDNDSKEILKSKHQTYNIYGNGGADHLSLPRNHTPIPETVYGDTHTMDRCVISSHIAPLENFNPLELPVYSDEARNSPLPNDIEESSKL